MGKSDEAAYYLRCAYNYRNVYNPDTRFFHPKDKEGQFIYPLDYRYDGGLGARDYYDENNGYVYRWDVQHNIADVIHLMGVPGDEDGGGMSSFVVFSQMGFYPVTPGSPTYNIGSPMFTNVKVNLGNGKTFEIRANNASDENKYIQSAKLNGVTLNQPWFNHSDLAEGGLLELEMDPKANKEWGTQAPPFSVGVMK